MGKVWRMLLFYIAFTKRPFFIFKILGKLSKMILKLFLLCICVCAHACVFLHMSVDSYRGQKNVLGHLELKLQAVMMWVLGSELRSLLRYYT